MANAVRAGEAYIELTSRDSKLVAGLRAAQAHLRQFGAACQAAGRELLTMSTIAAAPLALAVRQFAQFDDEMRKVGAIVRTTAEDFAMLTREARNIGRTTSYTANEAAGAMTALGRMGFDPKEIKAATAPVMALARATGTDLAQSADIAANTLRIFRKDASEMGDTVDVLTATANGSAQTLTDLFEALKIAGPQAGAAGESLRDVSAALGVLANMGVKGSLAGTALRKAYTQFTNPKIVAYLRSYGVRTADANGNLRKMRDILVDVAKAMASMPSAEKLAFAQEVFDTRGMTAGLALTVDTSQIDKFLAKLQQCEGAAKDAQGKMESGFGGAVRLLMSELSELGLTAAEIMIPSLTKLTEWIKSAAGSLRDLLAAHSSLGKVIVGVVGAAATAGAALVALGTAAKLLGLAVGAAKLALSAFHAVTVLTAGLRTAYTACMAAMTAATTAYTAAAAAGTGAVGAFAAAVTAFFATNPVGWILLAVGAIAGLAYAFSQCGEAAAGAARNMDEVAAANARMRDEAQQQMRRLQELAGKYSLTRDEMAEARKLAGKLGEEYGDLGIRFDEFAGRVHGAADALTRLNRAQKQQKILDVERQIAAKEAELKTRTDENKKQNSGWYRFWHDGENRNGTIDTNINRNKEIIKQLHGQINLLKARRAALTAPPPSAPRPGGATARGRISGQEFLAAQKQAEKMRVPAAPGEGSTAKRIAALRREMILYDNLMEKQEKFYAQQGDRKKAAELRKQADAAWAAYSAEIARLQKQEKDKSAAIDRRALDRVAGMDQSFAQAREQNANRAATARDQAVVQRGMAMDSGATVAALRKLVTQFEQSAAQAVKRYEQARKDAVKPDKDGRIRITGDEARAMQGARKQYDRSVALADHYRGLLQSAQDALRTSAASFGSFSVGDLLNLAGGGSAAERTAKATEIQNRLAETTNRLLQQIQSQKETW